MFHSLLISISSQYVQQAYHPQTSASQSWHIVCTELYQEPPHPDQKPEIVSWIVGTKIFC